MEKLDKVIAGLECCSIATKNVDACLVMCPYYGGRSGKKVCMDFLMEDALELARRCRELEEKLSDREIQLEVYRMNLGDTREELNRVETERDDLRKDVAVLTNENFSLSTELKFVTHLAQAYQEYVKTSLNIPNESDKPDEWRDNCDSYRCPSCGFETDNPNRLEDYGVRCPRCGKQLRWVIPEVADGNN